MIAGYLSFPMPVGHEGKKNKVLPARLELAIFGLLLEFQAHIDYETDALPTEPRKRYMGICYDRPIPFNRLTHPHSVYIAICGSDGYL
jgi:hypothetical protein